jgi:hypothetical protein
VIATQTMYAATTQAISSIPPSEAAIAGSAVATIVSPIMTMNIGKKIDGKIVRKRA